MDTLNLDERILALEINVELLERQIKDLQEALANIMPVVGDKR